MKKILKKISRTIKYFAVHAFGILIGAVLLTGATFVTSELAFAILSLFGTVFMLVAAYSFARSMQDVMKKSVNYEGNALQRVASYIVNRKENKLKDREQTLYAKLSIERLIKSNLENKIFEGDSEVKQLRRDKQNMDAKILRKIEKTKKTKSNKKMTLKFK
jgi:uncharacterized membrane protein YhiD involved in acid resistance